MTNHQPYVLLTIVTESALEARLLKELEKLGAKGYTVSDARGRGRSGVRNAGWSATGNIRIEIVCEKPLSQVIAQQLEAHYWTDYAMLVFTSEVNVLSPIQ